MANHTEILGDVSLPVGYYTDNQGKQKRRTREIGVLMETTWDDGNKGLSVKLNADVLNPVLFALVSKNTLKPGEDSVLCNVWPRKNANGRQAPAAAPAAGGSSAAAEMQNDQVPF